MATTHTSRWDKFWDSRIRSYNVQFLILDTNDKWVDFTNRIDTKGSSYGALTFVSESRDKTGLTSSRNTSIKLKNHDNFFMKPFPSTLTTQDGSTASFDTTSAGKHSILYNRKARFVVQVAYHDGSIEEGVAGTFLCGKTRIMPMSNMIELELKDMSLPLREDDSASRIKNGLNWWENRPVKFLVEEILRLRFQKADGTLPTEFIIPDRVQIESAASIAGESGDTRVLSHYGRLPELDNNGNWLTRGMTVRSIVMGPQTSNLDSSSSPSGSAPDKDRLYFGADDELWIWDPSTEQATLIDESTLGSDYLIRRLWYSSDQRKIYGMAWNEESFGQRTVTGKIFKYDGTSFTVLKTISGFYPGDHCYRDARQVDSTTTQIGGVSVSGAGENIPSAFPQRMRILGGTFEHFFEKTTSYDENPSSWDDGLTPVDTDGDSWYSFTVSGSGQTAPVHLQFSLGQKGFAVMAKAATASTHVNIWYATYDSVNEETDINKYNVVLDTTSTLSNLQETGNSIRLDPVCGCLNPDSLQTEIFIGGVAWDDTAGAGSISDAVIYKIDEQLNKTAIWTSTDEAVVDETNMPIDMVKVSSGKLLVSMMNRRYLGTRKAFSLVEIADSAGSTFTLQHRSRNLFVGLVVSEQDATKVYCYETGTGRLIKYTMTTGDVTFVDDGFSAVDNEYGLSCSELAIDSSGGSFNSEIIYGVSSPVPLPTDAYAAVSTGKVYLFKYDNFYSGRVPLAKTEGMSAWKFVEYLAQMSNHRTGFTRDGDFYFLPVTDEEEEITFDFDDEMPPGSIEVSSGEDEAYNVVRVNPYSVFLAPIETEVSLVARPEIEEDEEDDGKTASNEKPFDADVLVQQKDTSRKTIVLECIRGGLISNGDVLMRYRTQDETFETTLIAAYSGGTSLKIASGIDSIRAGDKIKITGGGNDETVTVLRAPTNAEKEDGDVTLTAAASNSYSIGDLVIITKNTSEWSDLRGNLIENPYFTKWSAGNLDDWTKSANITDDEDTTAGNSQYGGSSARLRITSGTDESISQNVASSEFEAGERYTFIVSGKIFEGDGTDNRTDEIEVKVTGATAIEATVTDTITSTDFARVALTFQIKASPSGNVTFEKHVKGTATTKAWVDMAICKFGVTATPDYINLAYDEFLPIPGTNIEIKFEQQQEETRMLVGDRILIRAPGLDLEKEDESKQTAIDTTSRGELGERPYPDIDNPFLGRSLARDVARRVLNANAFPKYSLSLRTNVRTNIDYVKSGKLTKAIVRGRNIFPSSGQFQEECAIKSISDNYLNGSSTLTLKSNDKE